MAKGEESTTAQFRSEPPQSVARCDTYRVAGFGIQALDTSTSKATNVVEYVSQQITTRMLVVSQAFDINYICSLML